jgi:hypothetical protein
MLSTLTGDELVIPGKCGFHQIVLNRGIPDLLEDVNPPDIRINP